MLDYCGEENAKLMQHIDELRVEDSWIQDQTGYQRMGNYER